jgi:hypothetical protein
MYITFELFVGTSVTAVNNEAVYMFVSFPLLFSKLYLLARHRWLARRTLGAVL